MLRILLLILVGFIVAVAAIRSIAGVIVFLADMKNGGQHAPEILGAMTASILITLGLGWVWKKIYFSSQTSSGRVKPLSQD
jgi:hypothetical protein